MEKHDALQKMIDMQTEDIRAERDQARSALAGLLEQIEVVQPMYDPIHQKIWSEAVKAAKQVMEGR